MESGSSVACSSTRKVKPRKKQKANEGEDIISKLPEALVSRILSFLPTKDAVRTSVLSKSWMYCWTTVTKLDLNDRNRRRRRGGDQQHFVSLVNRALLLSEGASMESISLHISDKYDASLLNTWLSSIFQRSAKHVEIHKICPFYIEKIPFSPHTSHSLFNSMSLEELSLQHCCGIKIPTTHVHFGCLKSLKFFGIEFTVDSSGGDHLTLSLPVLKKFEMDQCSWLNAKGIIVEAPLLEIIDIKQDIVLSAEPRSSAISFSALHLREIRYSGSDTSRTVILSDPSSAHNASASVNFKWSRVDALKARSCALLLLKQFSQVKCIYLSGLAVLTQSEVAILPVFAMLSHLELHSFTGDVLLGLLHRSPALKTLVVLKGISKLSQDLFNSTAVPDCLASTLRIVKFDYVTEEEYERVMFLAKYFMENGMVLERMSFSLARQGLGKSEVMAEFKEKLFSFKKAFSNFCVVDIFQFDEAGQI